MRKYAKPTVSSSTSSNDYIIDVSTYTDNRNRINRMMLEGLDLKGRKPVNPFSDEQVSQITPFMAKYSDKVDEFQFYKEQAFNIAKVQRFQADEDRKKALEANEAALKAKVAEYVKELQKELGNDVNVSDSGNGSDKSGI